MVLLRSWRLTLCLNGQICRFNTSGEQVQLTLVQMVKTGVSVNMCTVYIYVFEREMETGGVMTSNKPCLSNPEHENI